MAIPQSQLLVWAKQGPVDASSKTYQSIRNALTNETSPIKDLVSSGKVKVCLQGSYANDTNTRGDSDVDVVVELTDTFHSNKTDLPADQYAAHEKTYKTAEYQWQAFRSDVITALERYYGTQFVDKIGNKSIKVLPHSGRLRADVVPVTSYRKYSYFISPSDHDKLPGVHFFHRTTNRSIVNYPDQHYDNGVAKHQATNKQFKNVVRILKNARSYAVDKRLLADDKAPSYFLQGMIYNIPDEVFVEDSSEAVRGALQYLLDADLTSFVCQNEEHSLFGESEEQWNVTDATSTIAVLVELWNNWGR